MTKLIEKEVLQRLEKIRINSSYYKFSDSNFELFDVKDKDVNVFCFNIKKQKIFAQQKRQWQRKHEQNENFRRTSKRI